MDRTRRSLPREVAPKSTYAVAQLPDAAVAQLEVAATRVESRPMEMVLAVPGSNDLARVVPVRWVWLSNLRIVPLLISFLFCDCVEVV